MLLNETVPQWVIDITVDVSVSVIYSYICRECFVVYLLIFLLQKNMPKFNKIPFYLQPHSSSGAKTLKKYVFIKRFHDSYRHLEILRNSVQERDGFRFITFLF